jgi:serine/threonine protein phosphatase 1
MSKVLHFERNDLGRDFFVGDIHGCFELLEVRLMEIGFDESRDRLFSVGDLVDRGPSSEESINWIAKPWFHAARGNHEQMAIGVAAGKHDLGNYLANGGGWFLSMSEERKKLYAEAFSSLPYAMDIETDAGLIGVVHAECCVNSWDAFCDALDNPASNNKLRHVTEYALWARSKIQDLDTSAIDGLTILIVGHTPVNRPLVMGNVVYIDTGAVFGKGLTVMEASELMVHAA